MFAECQKYLAILQVTMSLLACSSSKIYPYNILHVCNKFISKFYVLKNKLSHPTVKAVFSSPLGNKQLQVVSVTKVASYTHIMITTLILSFVSDLCNNIDIILIPGL